MSLTLQESLLTILAEECGETAVRASKCIRFTMEEIQAGHKQTNAEQLVYEFNDIVAVMEMLHEHGWIDMVIDRDAIALKKKKMETWMEYSMKVKGQRI